MSRVFGNVRKNYFRLFFHYLYFDVARYSYLQVGVLAYAALAPTIVAGAVTLGTQQLFAPSAGLSHRFNI